MLIFPVVIVCPPRLQCLQCASRRPILNFVVLHISPNRFRRSRTLSKWTWCSYSSLENTITYFIVSSYILSSRYTYTNPFWYPLMTSFMSLTNVIRLFFRPNERTQNWKRPLCVWKAVYFHAFLCSGTCQYSLRRSYLNTKNFRAPHLPNNFV